MAEWVGHGGRVGGARWLSGRGAVAEWVGRLG